VLPSCSPSIICVVQADDEASDTLSQQLLDTVAAAGWLDSCNSVLDRLSPVAPSMGSILTESLSCDWHTRMSLALAMPEVTEGDVLAKYSEISSIARDFSDIASRIALQIVRQRGICSPPSLSHGAIVSRLLLSLLFLLSMLFLQSLYCFHARMSAGIAACVCLMLAGLPEHLRELKPAISIESPFSAQLHPHRHPGSTAHMHCRKDVFNEHNMWIKVAGDYDGFYDGCDEYAMKVRVVIGCMFRARLLICSIACGLTE
jgi:hypothetical protein